MIFQNSFQVIWQNIEYNIGSGIDVISGKFTAPVDGVYFFHTQGRTYGNNGAYIYIYVYGSQKAYEYRRDDVGYEVFDTIATTAQFKLQKEDIVHVKFYGHFFNPEYSQYAYFEGHLIGQTNE